MKTSNPSFRSFCVALFVLLLPPFSLSAQPETGAQRPAEAQPPIDPQTRTKAQPPIDPQTRTKAQPLTTALATSMRIADKVIRESSFEYHMAPLSYNGGITGLHFPREEAGSVHFALIHLESEFDSSAYLGLAFCGQIRVCLNGTRIFEGSADRADLKEYTYNRYRFQEKIPVTYRKGKNTILVKWCPQEADEITPESPGASADPGAGANEPDLAGVPGDAGRGCCFILPQNVMDEKVPFVNPLPAHPELPHVYWILNGPWTAGGPEHWTNAEHPLNRAALKSDPMARSFPPEKGFQPYYRKGEGIMAWEYQQVPLLRELKIPEESSYQRDPYTDWHYANGGTLLALLQLYEQSAGERYLDFVKDYSANLLGQMDYFRWQYEQLHAMRGSFHRLFRMTMLDDSGGPVLPLLQLKLLEPELKLPAGTEKEQVVLEEAYRQVLDSVYAYVMYGQERLTDKTFSRPEPEEATVWADDLFMSVPYLLRMARIRKDPSLYDEVVRQVIQFNRYLVDEESGLYFHGWYDQRKENTPVRWGRANGWIVWATSEALLHLPEKHPGYRPLLKIYRKHLEALAAFQDPSGMWHQVLDHPETFEESSCTAMFCLGMARGVRMGWLKKSYAEKAQKAWEALQARIAADGTVSDICRGTGIGENVDFYAGRKRFDHDPRGLGAMITAGIEMHLLSE